MISNRLQKDFDELFGNNNEWIKRLDNNSILITGATGLIGSVIARAIRWYNEEYDSNIKVICHVRNEDKAKEIFENHFNKNNFEIIVGDINHNIIYDGRVDYIIHCANTTSSKEYIEKPVETIKTIVNGTDNVLRFACEKKIKRMIYISSMEAYGSISDDSKRTAEGDYGYIDTTSVRSSYPEGKRAAECLCSSYASEYGIKVVIARLAQIFGAGVNPDDNRVFMQLARCVIEHKDFIMHSDGSSRGNYCYSTDAVKAIIMLLNDGKTGEIYNVVNEECCVTIKEMAEMVSYRIADCSFKVIFDESIPVVSLGYAPKTGLRLSAEKISRLGWTARIGLIDMYERLIDYLLHNK